MVFSPRRLSVSHTLLRTGEKPDRPDKLWQHHGRKKGASLLSIVIVEDRPLDRMALEKHVARYQAETHQDTRVDGFESGEYFLASYRPVYDVVFMDIMLPGENGMKTAEALRKMDSEVALIFVTDMRQYALQGYKVGALDYFIKPVEYYDVKITIVAQDLASFDWDDKNGNGFTGYELEAGDYILAASRDAHAPVVCVTRSVAETILCETDLVTGETISEDQTARPYPCLGVPYAQQPIGELRWKAPQPLKPWDGVWQADHFRNCAMQPFREPGFYDKEFRDDQTYITPCSVIMVRISTEPVIIQAPLMWRIFMQDRSLKNCRKHTRSSLRRMIFSR